MCRIHQLPIWRYGSTLSGTLSLLFSPSGTKALMRQFVADAPKAHESLSTEARRVPVQGTPIPLISVFIAPFCFGTIWNDLFFTKIAELLGLTVSINLDDSTTAGGAWHFCVGRLLLLHSKSGPVALSIITASVDWLSDKRYMCVRINHQIGPLSRTKQKSLWPQAVCFFIYSFPAS